MARLADLQAGSVVAVEVAPGDVVVVFSRRSTGRSARRLALAEGRAPAS